MLSELAAAVHAPADGARGSHARLRRARRGAQQGPRQRRAVPGQRPRRHHSSLSASQETRSVGRLSRLLLRKMEFQLLLFLIITPVIIICNRPNFGFIQCLCVYEFKDAEL